MSTAATQDLPPKGGFEPLQYKRNLPIRGPSGLVLFASVIGVCAYGWYGLVQGLREQRELKREKIWARVHLCPLLQAESDRNEAQFLDSQRALEDMAMKDVPDWDKQRIIYHSKRYVPPTVLVAEKQFLNLW